MTNKELTDRIVSALTDAERPLRSMELAAIVYAGDPDGGPLGADSRIRNAIARTGNGRIVSTPSGYVLSASKRVTVSPTVISRGKRLAEIRRMRRQSFSYAEIAARFGLSEKYACRLCMRSLA